jgi:hypothetical protein
MIPQKECVGGKQAPIEDGKTNSSKEVVEEGFKVIGGEREVKGPPVHVGAEGVVDMMPRDNVHGAANVDQKEKEAESKVWGKQFKRQARSATPSLEKLLTPVGAKRGGEPMEVDAKVENQKKQKGVEGEVMSTHFYSCRHLLGLQVQRFVEQQQVSFKWITQGLSNSGRKRSKLPLSNNPAITIQKVSCVPNTPNTLVKCIGALVRRRDSEIQVV